MSARVGPQRLSLLETVGNETAAGRAPRPRDLMNATNLTMTRVSNVVMDDVKRGLLARRGVGIVMTPKGFEFLRHIGSAVGQKSAPAETQPADLLGSAGVSEKPSRVN